MRLIIVQNLDFLPSLCQNIFNSYKTKNVHILIACITMWAFCYSFLDKKKKKSGVPNIRYINRKVIL